jgi:hypothetical protein
LDPDRARAALQRAVVNVLVTAAADPPLLVVLNDVHDADAASLALATLVCRGLPDSPQLVVTTQRPVGPAGQAATATLLGELQPSGVSVPVGALDQAAVAAQAPALAGAQLAPQQVALAASGKRLQPILRSSFRLLPRVVAGARSRLAVVS